MNTIELPRILCYNGMHFLKLLFHIADQLELGTAAIQILLGVVDVKVIVTIQIICQEADAAFQRHQLGTPRQILQLSCG